MVTRYRDRKYGTEDVYSKDFEYFTFQVFRDVLGLQLRECKSKKDQFSIGDFVILNTGEGVECKLDRRMSHFVDGKNPTNRASIEIAEKKDLDQEYFLPSGIYSKASFVWYVHGNFLDFYIFDRNELIRLHERGIYQEDEEPTIRKFYLPQDTCERHCAMYLGRPFVKNYLASLGLTIAKIKSV